MTSLIPLFREYISSLAAVESSCAAERLTCEEAVKVPSR